MWKSISGSAKVLSIPLYEPTMPAIPEGYTTSLLCTIRDTDEQVEAVIIDQSIEESLQPSL